MKNSFTLVLEFDQSPEQVYRAILSPKDWWQGEIIGEADKLNATFDYRMEPFHYSTQRVVELVPTKRVVWQIVASKLTFVEEQEEWTGTKVVFDLKEQGGKTVLEFSHEGLLPEFSCYSACSNGWTQLLQRSLKSLLLTGKGEKVF